MEDREAERQRAKDRHKSKRRKQSIWWDLAPRGFEHISPLQYKAMQGTFMFSKAEMDGWRAHQFCVNHKQNSHVELSLPLNDSNHN